MCSSDLPSTWPSREDRAIGLRLLVDTRFQGLFHSPLRGAFHLSLTVLVHYRSPGSIQPWRVVPPDSHRVSRVPRYSGVISERVRFRIRGYHPLWLRFPADFSNERVSDSVAVLQPRPDDPTTPMLQRLQAWHSIGLGSSPFARRYLGNLG